MSPIQFIAIFLGSVLAAIGLVWGLVVISCKRDEKKYAKKKAENQARLSRIKKYLDSIAYSLDEDGKHLIFKLQNRWEIIYKWYPIHVSGMGYTLPPHPQLLSACIDRDRLEVELMDKGIRLEYPD